MSEEMSIAFMLMGVGMITVFVVLLLVYITGNLLVAFVNKYVPLAKLPESKPSDISNAKVAAITSAIEVFTKGKGTITNIKKQ